MSNAQNPFDEEVPGDARSALLSRRRILKGAIATAPAIATIPSGAALARSSNVIGTTTPASALDAQGRTLCLDRRSGTGEYVDGGMDLGDPARGWVNAIRDRDHRVEAKFKATAISESDMCQKGGTYYHWKSGWQKTQVPRGMLVSATALSSFAGGIVVREI